MARGGNTFPIWVWPVVAVSIVGIILIVILIPISFSYLDYYDYGFVRRRTSGRVDLSRVYEGGRYFIGPDHK